jgi:inhibitor of cysteine peptidase
LQREIKNKTLTYGIAALLLAVILSATVYNFGIQPTVTPDSNAPPDFEAPPQTEEPPTTEAPMTEEPTAEPPSNSPPELPEPAPQEAPQLETFSSYEELETFLTEGMEKSIQSENLARFNVVVNGRMVTAQDTAPQAAEAAGGIYSMGSEYSTTNVQVAGVDEADTVKSDGENLYVISGQTIYILKAYPPDQAEVLSKIELDESYDAQIYVNENKLVVLGSLTPYLTYGFAEVTIGGELWINPSVYNEEVFLKVYDITNRADPVLSRTVTLNGTLSGSRMIGDYVYAVVRQVATQTSSNVTEVVLPTISGSHTIEVQPTEIRYIDTPDVYYYMTTVVAVDAINDSEEPTYEAFLTGQTTTMYVSLNNMYLVAPNTNMWIFSANGEEPREESMIFRIALNQEEVVAMAEGAVSGHVLNQFSMDEYSGTFRIATTTNNWWSDGVSKNHLFILNMSLNVVGELEDLAPGESIYSTRFVGDRGYIVTFRKIDPLFVIDLSEPTNPTVLGQLKVTGYSDYLHPYDETHLIGIGKETEASEEGDFAWYQGVKISLFDVSDVSNPVEVAKYEIGDRGTDSPVLNDHKALLFDKEKNLLVIPVLVAEIDPNDYAGEVPDWAYGEYVWQGAYVFDISLDGLGLRGNITHIDDYQELLKSGYYFSSEYEVERALYIGNVLYTVSDKLVKMNNLESLVSLNEIELS